MFRANPLFQPAVVPSPGWIASLAAPPEGPAFTPWHEEPAASPASNEPGPAVEPEPADVPDPAIAEAEAFAAGFEEGRRSLEAEIAAERQGIARLLESLEALKPEPAEPLAALLAETVERLVREIVGTAEIDGELLRQRAAEAAALIGEETEPACLFAHPDDLPLLEPADLAVGLCADPALPRGSVRLERSSGWVEDGPEVRLDRLRAALARLGAGR